MTVAITATTTMPVTFTQRLATHLLIYCGDASKR